MCGYRQPQWSLLVEYGWRLKKAAEVLAGSVSAGGCVRTLVWLVVYVAGPGAE